MEATATLPLTAPAARPGNERELTPRQRLGADTFRAGQRLLSRLEKGEKLDRHALRDAMTRQFKVGAASGLWNWKDASDAAETATNLFLYRYGRVLLKNADPCERLNAILKIGDLEAPYSGRDDEKERLQAFSSPLGLAMLVVEAAAIRPDDLVLEPSAGTGTLAVIARTRLDAEKGGSVRLNEISGRRAEILRRVFTKNEPVTELDAEQLHERLDGRAPTIVVMNPPFSRSVKFKRRRHEADLTHVASAFRTLAPGGRLVTVTSEACRPGDEQWRQAFDPGRGPVPEVRWTAPIDRNLYKSRGTTFGTRITVLDKPRTGEEADTAPGHRGTEALGTERAVLEQLLRDLPARRVAERRDLVVVRAPEPGETPETGETAPGETPKADGGKKPKKKHPKGPVEYTDTWGEAVELKAIAESSTGDPDAPEPNASQNAQPSTGTAAANGKVNGQVTNSPFIGWRAASILSRETAGHPTKLVESAAMASVPHVQPGADILLPEAAMAGGALSDAQLESVLLAVSAHGDHLSGLYCVNDSWSAIRRAAAYVEDYWDKVRGTELQKAGATKVWLQAQGDNGLAGDGNDEGNETWSAPVRVRQGWMLGDGTGTGKGRQVAAIIADRWTRGERRALWVSQSETLIEDAQRDWKAIGGNPDETFSLRRYKANARIDRTRGILFITYATLRSPAAAQRRARLDQIIEWLAGSTNGKDRRHSSPVIVFDEAHAMANAAGTIGSRGPIAPSRQGLTSMRLQNALPDARVVYVSATGASSVNGLSYANRLGLWASERTPFETREAFIEAMNNGGIAALELMSRDMKALGLYQSRALANDGVEIEILQHTITEEQQELYDNWANAFQIIHRNLRAALEAAHVVSDEGKTLNKDRKGAANSRFESVKQRFFGHMLCAMKLPSLIPAMERNLERAESAVVQLVSTGEALMNRRLAKIPPAEWDDLQIDLTPREYVLEYLTHAFPVQLHEEYEDDEHNVLSRPVYNHDGSPVECREAVRMRERLLDRLSTAPALPGALDSIVQHFGTDKVAEISGRSRRVVRRQDPKSGLDRYSLETRSPSSNLTETAAFQDGDKRIIVFSLAGNTGRSYHADKNALNADRRHHYLLEAGWRPDQAIQGLGRTHRTHQWSAPLFIPVTTNIKAERRFISTIASRLSALGAITRGQRDSQSAMTDSGGELFRQEDNFENEYAAAALREFFHDIANGRIAGWPEKRFTEVTGLELRTNSGEIRETLPPMSRTLNRLLALTIAEQDELFAELAARIDKNIESAKLGGTYDHGVEELRAVGITVGQRLPVPDTGATLVELDTRQRVNRRTVKEARRFLMYEESSRQNPWLAVNEQSGNAAIVSEGPSRTNKKGGVIRRLRLTRPGGTELKTYDELARSRWCDASSDQWETAWEDELTRMPEHRHETVWLICGTLLPLWNRLPDSRPRVYRAVTDEGERLIGRRLDDYDLTKFKISMNMIDQAGAYRELYTFEQLMETGQRVQLANHWQIVKRLVMDEERLTINNTVYEDLDTLRRIGCTTERIHFAMVVTIPNAAVFDRVVTRQPVTGALES